MKFTRIVIMAALAVTSAAQAQTITRDGWQMVAVLDRGARITCEIASRV